MKSLGAFFERPSTIIIVQKKIGERKNQQTSVVNNKKEIRDQSTNSKRLNI